MAHLDDELRRARDARDTAMAGKTGDEALEAGIRASYEYAMRDAGKVADLERALGVPVDAGAFFIGMQSGMLVMQGLNAIDVAAHPVAGLVLREFMDRARAEAGQQPHD